MPASDYEIIRWLDSKGGWSVWKSRVSSDANHETWFAESEADAPGKYVWVQGDAAMARRELARRLGYPVDAG